MQFTELSEKEFKEFTDKSNEQSFFQTINMYNRYKENNYETYLVGVKENNKVLAASLVVSLYQKYGYKIFNIYKGYILDYNDKKLIDFMTINIKKFLKSKKGLILYIDPNIVSVSRDNEFNITNETNNLEIKDYLCSLGYKYIGEYEQVKWTYVLDLENKTEDEIFKNFKSNHRNIINKAINKYNVEIRKLSYEELPLFRKITSYSANKQGFKDKSLKYYQDMFKHFKDEVIYLGSFINPKKILENLNNELIKLKEKYNKTNNANRKKVYKIDIDNLEKEIKEVKELPQEEIMISASMFMLYGREVVYLFSGSLDAYQKFGGSYLMQWYIIKYALNNGYKRYNFYGIKNNKSDGVYKFKHGFNGNVEELLGTFALPINLLGKIYISLKSSAKK